MGNNDQTIQGRAKLYTSIWGSSCLDNNNNNNNNNTKIYNAHIVTH